MADGWFYQINGFELGPVPESELRRLLQKGRVALDTPLRAESAAAWGKVEDVLRAPAAEVAAVAVVEPAVRPGVRLSLSRSATFGVPAATALLFVDDRRAAFLGGMVLAGIAVWALRKIDATA